MRHIGQIQVVPLDGLWKSLEGVPSEDKIRQALDYSGCEFYDDSRRVVTTPAVSLVAIGGIPVAYDHESDADIEQRVQSMVAATRETMASSAAFSYLNSGEKQPSDLYETVTGLGHFSIAHSISVNILLAGISAGTETEISLQRDIVHISKLTNARTIVQNNPPIVVTSTDNVEEILEVQDRVSELAGLLRTDARGDTLEFANGMFPVNKATIMMLSGSLKNMKKLAELKDDQGKEAGLRQVSNSLYNILTALWPEIMEGES